MLQFCNGRLWLSEDHINKPALTNVLTEPVMILDDGIAAAKLLNADIYGRVVASLHLCTKMPDLFGDVSLSESKYYFEVEDPRRMRNHFTTAFQIKNMAKLFDLCVGKKMKMRKKEDVQKKMVRRISEISNANTHLNHAIREFDRDDPRYLAAIVLLDQIQLINHIFTAKNFSFRATLDTDDSYREFSGTCYKKLSFLSCLQEELDGELVNAQRFISVDRFSALEGARSIHIDISPDVLVYPSARIGVKTVGDCIKNKVSRKVFDILGNDESVYKEFLEIHIHLGVKTVHA